jgi:hypothetical protein
MLHRLNNPGIYPRNWLPLASGLFVPLGSHQTAQCQEGVELEWRRQSTGTDAVQWHISEGESRLEGLMPTNELEDIREPSNHVHGNLWDVRSRGQTIRLRGPAGQD